jgi:trehalose 6-phosphate synthase/phosphatase
MKLTLRFLLPVLAALALLAYALVPFVEHLMEVWSVRDLNIRSVLIGKTVGPDLQRLLVTPDDVVKNRKRLQAALEKATEDERLLALQICDSRQKVLMKTDNFPAGFGCSTLDKELPFEGKHYNLPSGSIHVSYALIELPEPETMEPSDSSTGGIAAEETEAGAPLQPSPQPIPPEVLARAVGFYPLKLMIVQDMSYVDRRSRETTLYMALVFLSIGILVALLVLGIARWSLSHWVQSVRSLVVGVRNPSKAKLAMQNNQEFLPILRDVQALVKEMETTRLQQDDSRMTWNAATLRDILKKQLSGERVIVASNREPYIHIRKGDRIKVQKPASGLVTALEPILRACSGTWVAHGSGNADREVVDDHDRVRVPPEKPSYSIRRIWLTDEEEQGYYFGFANEGLWPLCHIAHTRPKFRSEDWHCYMKANQKFAQAVCEEATDPSPVILVQDYHLALAPLLIRSQLPQATILSFWHIPWPNAESFGICPWRNEILSGLLGSSILGFHTQFHCNNFMECVDRYLEARIDRETNTIIHKGRATQIRAYPISIEWPPKALETTPPASECRLHLQQKHGIDPKCKIGVGIDRLDYTKGIVERLRSVEKLLQKDPQAIGNFVFIQISAPSRSSISSYREFAAEVDKVVAQINAEYSQDDWQPIVYLPVHHEAEEVYQYLRAADICLVTSLHDGMNLVAKEFVAAHDDEQGVLILSTFAGASRELTGALIVNPYDIDQTAQALAVGLRMSPEEQRERMILMRTFIREFNVYRWAGRMLMDASRIRLLEKLQHVRLASHGDESGDSDTYEFGIMASGGPLRL